jgi:integrase
MMRKAPKYTCGYIDSRGKPRWYFRRRGFKQIPLCGLPWSPEFMADLSAAMAGSTPATEVGSSQIIPGTVAALVTAFLDCSPQSSSPLKAQAANTQRDRRYILEKFSKDHGSKPLYRTDSSGRRMMLLTQEIMQRVVNAKSDMPFAQRNFLNALRSMFQWAVREGRVPSDPTAGVLRAKTKSTGYRTWSEAEIEKFEAAHPIGTKARLAFGLLLFTGQRRSDVVRMGTSHIHRGILTIDQRKTEGQDEAHVEIPVHPKLREIIDGTTTVGTQTFLVNSDGRAFTPERFGNWFRELCDLAGCSGVSAHGLRKAAARRLAELGCSAHEIASITGHASLREVERYTKAASRKRLAHSAMKKLIESGS